MIPLAEINLIAKNFQVAAETIEKDYVISWILLCLSKSMLKDNFVFYGGTAIKRMYFEEHRFSEDIDLFSTHKVPSELILKELSCLTYAHKKANLALQVNQESMMTNKHRIQLYVNYLGYDEIIGAPKEIRLDFSTDMDLYGKIIDKKMIESYSDIKQQNIQLSVMTLNTIFANKLGLLFDITRNEPRDLFDIWFLLQRKDIFDFDFDQICETFRNKFSFFPSLSSIVPQLKNAALKQKWNTRLRKQLSELPDIDKVINDIIAKLKMMFVED